MFEILFVILQMKSSAFVHWKTYWTVRSQATRIGKFYPYARFQTVHTMGVGFCYLPLWIMPINLCDRWMGVHTFYKNRHNDNIRR
jgi:hypothetical protein